jgi:serine/threonine protein kinase/CHAT domain-containing protein/tetratricopeptide (TPR) repeat protein
MKPETPAAFTDQTIDWAQPFGQYELAEVIGRGGMGEVYRARHRVLDRTVAIKIIKDHQPTPEKLRRFEREILALGKLAHPNIVQALDAGCINGIAYVATEFLVGANANELLGQIAMQPIAIGCEIALRCASALLHAHQNGFIHRDVKPANVMITWDGHVKLLDLGLVSTCQLAESDTNLTMERQVLGTPDYMSPEQATDPSKVTAASDCYSLGCFLFALLAGQPPFASSEHDSMGKKLLAHQFEAPRRLTDFRSDIPIKLHKLIGGMLSKAPQDRPSLQQVLDCLRPLADSQQFGNWIETVRAKSNLLSMPSLVASRETEPVEKVADSTIDYERVPSPRPTRHLSRRVFSSVATRPSLALATLFVLAASVALLFTSRTQLDRLAKSDSYTQSDPPTTGHSSQRPSSSSIVESFRLTHYRSVGSVMKQFEFPSHSPARVGDDFRLEIEFSRPAFAYLLALNPDGSTQLCLPEDDQTVPVGSTYLQLYPEASDFFTTVEGEGTLAFVLLTSEFPLPNWRDWLASHSIPSWEHVSSIGVWSYQDSSWSLLSPHNSQPTDSTRGGRTSRNPELLRRICQSLASQMDFTEVRCISLPIELSPDDPETGPAASASIESRMESGVAHHLKGSPIANQLPHATDQVTWKRIQEIVGEVYDSKQDTALGGNAATLVAFIESWEPADKPISAESLLGLLRHFSNNDLVDFAIQVAARLESDSGFPELTDRPFTLWAIERLGVEAFTANQLSQAIPLLAATVKQYQTTGYTWDHAGYSQAIKLLVYALRRDHQQVKARESAELLVTETRRILGDFTYATVAAYSVLFEGIEDEEELESAYQLLQRLYRESHGLSAIPGMDAGAELVSYRSSLAGLLGLISHRTRRFEESPDLLSETIKLKLLDIGLRRYYSHVRIDAYRQLNRIEDAVAAAQSHLELLAQQPTASLSQHAAGYLTLSQIYFGIGNWISAGQAIREAQVFVEQASISKSDPPSLNLQSDIRILDARIASENPEHHSVSDADESLVAWHKSRFLPNSRQTIEAVSVASIRAIKRQNREEALKLNCELLDLLLENDNWSHQTAHPDLLNAPARIESLGELELAGEYRSRHISLLESHAGIEAKYLVQVLSAYSQNLIWQHRYAEAELVCAKNMELCGQLWGLGSHAFLQAANTRAVVLGSEGRDQESLDAYQQIFKICAEHCPERLESDSILWSNLGESFRRLGRHTEAIDSFRKATEVAVATGQRDTAWFGMLINNHAFAYLSARRFDEAESMFREAILHWNRIQHPDASASEGGLAQVYLGKGERRQAIRILENLVQQCDVGGSSPYKTRLYALLAYRAMMKEGELDKADEMLRIAYRNEDEWRRLADRPFLSGGSELQLDAGIEMIASQAAAGHVVEAWQSWEKQSATKSMFEQRLRFGTDSERRIGNELRALYSQIESLHCDTHRVNSGDTPLQDDLRKLRLSHKIAELQWRTLLDPDSSLVEPDLSMIQAIMPERSAIVGWVDRNSDLGEMHEMNRRWLCVILKAGPPVWLRLTNSKEQAEQCYYLVDRGREMLSRPVDFASRPMWLELAKQIRDCWVAPLDSILVDSAGKRVIDHLFLIPNESLQGFPLDTLFHDQLITCSYSSSATFLSEILARDGKPLEERPDSPSQFASSPWLVMADPIFDTGSPVTKTLPDSNRLAVRGVEGEDDRSELHYPPLPGTRDEALAITKFASKRTEVDLRLGSEASVKALYRLVNSGELGKFGVIHIATHAVANPSHPLKSYLVLSSTYETDDDDGSASVEMGSTVAADQILFDWNLNARLVVLSACQTGVGKYVPGEGVVGFSQSFLLAGSHSVLLSLWKVDDTATSLLMMKFYELMLDQAADQDEFRSARALLEAKQWLQNLTAAEIGQVMVDALGVERGVKTRRDAPLEPQTEKDSAIRPFNDPYYWAGFILTGSPR